MPTSRTFRRALAAVALAACLLAGGCSALGQDQDRQGRGDAPVGEQDRTPAEIISNPDGFLNVAHKCDGHGHRVYITTGGGNSDHKLFVIDDSSCSK